MAGQFNRELLEILTVDIAVNPVNLATGLNSGAWISMQNINRLAILIQMAAGTTANDVTVTLKQATDNAGTSAKALNFTRFRVKTNAAATFTLNTQAAANTCVLTGTSAFATLAAVEVQASDLDNNNITVTNGVPTAGLPFNHVQVTISQAGATALGSVSYLGDQIRFAQTNPPTNLS